ARNKTINALRTKEPTSNPESRLEIGANVMALSDSSMEGIIEGLELGRLIQDVYDSLPDSAKDSFIMSRKYGMTNKEIAEKEGLTVKAVEYHIKISLRIFKEKLKDYLPLLLWWLLG
ncbi:MAG: sigma factor-like helix-turn-helix DNA-binding protein, partial [Bacteroidales bacterium]